MNIYIEPFMRLAKTLVRICYTVTFDTDISDMHLLIRGNVV